MPGSSATWILKWWSIYCAERRTQINSIQSWSGNETAHNMWRATTPLSPLPHLLHSYEKPHRYYRKPSEKGRYTPSIPKENRLEKTKRNNKTTWNIVVFLFVYTITMWIKLIDQWKRRCYKCKKIKRLNDHVFRKCKKSSWGLAHICKICSRKQSREMYQKKKAIAQKKWNIYVIKSGCFFKIWFSNNIDARLKHVRIHCPFDAEIFASYHVEKPRQEEKRIHTALEQYHVKWERYKTDEKTIRSVLK